MSKIHRLGGGGIADDGVDTELVEMLEGIIERVRRREFVDLAVVATLPSGKSFDAWVIRSGGMGILGALNFAAFTMSAHTASVLSPAPGDVE